MLITVDKILVKHLLISLSILAVSNCKNYEFRLIQSTNFQRQELLQQMCDKAGDKYAGDTNDIHSLADRDVEHLLIDRQHKFLYCYVPKVILIGMEVVLDG